jgi:TM2 domain-containing membrane protein YozV
MSEKAGQGIILGLLFGMFVPLRLASIDYGRVKVTRSQG